MALGAIAALRPSEIGDIFGERPGLRWEDIDFEARHIHVRPEVAGKLAEPRYITFTAKPERGLSQELADRMWETLSSWLLPVRKRTGEITGRRTQRDMSVELRSSEVIEDWPKDGLRHTWISSLLAQEVHRDWVTELAGNSPGIIRTNYKGQMSEKWLGII